MNPENITEDVRRALAEDVGSGDLTAQLIPADSNSSGHILCRDSAILCGCDWVDEVFRQLDDSISIKWNFRDGDTMSENDIVCELSGNSRALLTGERTALNFLQTLSGTATLAGLYNEAIGGTRAKILDTRKTLPGMRRAQKYAVACGGGHNHRMGLYDAILIKENHVSAAGSVSAALEHASAVAGPDIDIEIEVENLTQLTEALASGVKHVLLDNFILKDIVTAVQMNRRRAVLEASGGITLDNVREIAKTGVDYISVGELTKNVIAIDFSMRLEHQ
ncbi:MAG: carboxylating nicotinate-nucleotide diphosphorylase [Acidiferrobacterales bacterium]|nr:carboxylating nicotinate-nucleotide diphosphorylase [Acidiferrobacterales bacterium]